MTNQLSQHHHIRNSMAGKGCYRAFENGKALQQGLKRYFDWYNYERPHQGLDDQTSDAVYRGLPHWRRAV
jgi:putative transposase